MLDETRYEQRCENLRPENIIDIDVLDPAPFFPYIRNAREWLETIKTFYEPFLAARARRPDAQALTNRELIGSPMRWFSSNTTSRFRVLMVSNIVGAWASYWIDTLREDDTLIIINTPEWNLSAFKPEDFDLLILLDCAYPAILSTVEAFNRSGVPMIYASTHALDDRSREKNAVNRTRGIFRLMPT